MTMPFDNPDFKPGHPDWVYPTSSWTIKAKWGEHVANVHGINGVYGVQWFPWRGCSPFTLKLEEVIRMVGSEIGYREARRRKRNVRQKRKD